MDIKAREAPPGWRWVPCPLCGSTESELVFESRNMLFGTDERASMRRCPCGLCLTNPQPFGEALARYYQTQEYYTHDAGRSLTARLKSVSQRWQLRGPLAAARRSLERCTDLQRFTSRFATDSFALRRGQRLLDFGCGSGDVAALCVGLGMEVFGVEPDPKARDAAAARGLKAAPSLKELVPDGRGFDRIILRHVLEHVPDPVATLRELGERLTAHGRLLVAVPNVEAHQARVFGEAWIGYDMPRHLWHFSARTLGSAATAAGLGAIVMKTVELAGFERESRMNLPPDRRAGLQGTRWSARAVESLGEGTELVAVLAKSVVGEGPFTGEQR
jgi:2-polyprenyl-3-methyl-5-hydroxy-6-metoxy-1,4-benzoquinol methylase